MRFRKIRIFILGCLLLTGGSTRLWAGSGTATIDATVTDQVINGFGGCSAWHEAAFAANLATWFWNDTGTVVNGGVTSASGIGMSLLRCHIPYTNTVGSTGGTGIGDPGETAVMNQAIGLGVTQIWCTEWTPPTAYKTNGAADCATCNPNAEGECTCTNNTFNSNNTGYAGYLVNYIQYVNAQLTGGVKVMAVSPQNEPDWNPSYESAVWTAAQFDAFVPVLYSALQTAGLSTKVMIPESFADNQSLASTTMDDANAAKDVGIIGNHLYGLGGGQPYGPLSTTIFSQYTNQFSWETEMSDVSGAANDLTMKSGFQEAAWIQQCIVGAGMNAFHHWWLQNTSDADNEGLIGEDNNSTKKLWVLGNWSRFVRPGYYRMGATTSPSAGVSLSAFKSDSTTAPATFVVVAINNSGAPCTVTFNLNSLNAASVTPWLTDPNDNLTQEAPQPVTANSFTYTMPVSSVMSFVGATTVSAATATFTRTSTPTATKTATPTSTPTATITLTQTATASATPTASRTVTPTLTATSTATVTFTRTASPTATLVNTATSTATATVTRTATSTVTPVNTPTTTATSTSTATRTSTPTPDATSTATPTLVLTATPTATLVNTATSTETPTATRTATSTATPVNTPTSTASSTSTATPSVTLTPVFSFTPTSTPTVTAVPTLTNTPTATSSSTVTSTATPTLVNTATPSATFTRTASSTATFTRTPTPTNTSTTTLTPTTTPSFTATATETFTATPTPTQTLIPTATRTATALPTLTSTPVIAHGPVVFPDPWNGNTPVYLEVYQPEASRVEIRIITVSFRQVREWDQSLPAGFSQVPLNLEGLANGLYYVLVQSSDGRQITKLLILR